MKVRGHTLVWHSQLPSWMKSLSGSAATLAAMKDHINGVMAHYKGKLALLGRGQRGLQRGRQPPVRRLADQHRQRLHRGGVHRPPEPPTAPPSSATTTTTSRTGPTPRRRASTTWSRTSSPAASRSTASASRPTSPAAARCPQLPDDAVQTSPPSASTWPSPRLDVTNAGRTQYANLTKACLTVSRCVGITVWGVRDSDSWRSSENPLLFDGSGNKKAAYTAVLNALNGTVGPDPTIDPTVNCSAILTVQNTWAQGFVAAVKVTAGTSPISGWTVGLGVESGTSISSVWNGQLSGTSVSNVSWNGALNAGGNAEFGIQGLGSSSGLTVTGCTAG